MADDPFVAAHEILEFEYDLTGRFLPGSIRDQMVRACMLVDRLFRGRLAKGDRVLIVGAGPAGVTAAIRAARAGAVVDLVERTPAPFFVQRDVSSRHISPTLYDWPMEHWKEEFFPLNGTEVPLAWAEGPAVDVAADWMRQLSDAKASLRDRLTIRYRTEFLESKRDEGGLTARLRDSEGVEYEQSFRALIRCTGGAGERTWISDYNGPKFWSDTWLAPRPESLTLVVGGGDGALQDFLQLATGQDSTREIFNSVLPAGAREDVRNEVLCAERQAHRAGLWSSGGSHDCELLRELEHAHAGIVNRVRRSERKACDALGMQLELRKCRVQLLHPCLHFHHAYATNRFLTLLVIALMEEMGQGPRIAGYKVESILSTEHQCSLDNPAACYSFPHEVISKRSACEATAGPLECKLQCGRIVIRAGLPLKDTRRQSLPWKF